MKSIDAQSCRALKSRGSRTSRRIVIRTSTNGLPNQEAVPRILFCAQRNTPIFICDSPGKDGEGISPPSSLTKAEQLLHFARARKHRSSGSRVLVRARDNRELDAERMQDGVDGFIAGMRAGAES